MKHDIGEAMTPAWVTKDKHRAEYLQRIAQAERRMGSVRRHVSGNQKEKGGGGDGSAQNIYSSFMPRIVLSSAFSKYHCRFVLFRLEVICFLYLPASLFSIDRGHIMW